MKSDMNKILKVMLVDDETFVLERIRKTITWGGMGFELIGCCTNALVALDCMVDEMPDILITDVKMPVMNGLELIERTKRMNPLVECVVLSGYAEFDIAKTAMQQGVKHYLLKPFSKADFEIVLEKCKKQILSQMHEPVIRLEKRTEIIEQIAWELQILKEKYKTVDVEKVRTLMEAYSDLDLLRSALIYLVSNSLENNHSLLECVVRLFNTEQDIYDVAVYTLNELLREKTNESMVVRKIKEYTKEHYNEECLNLQLIADNVVHWGVKYTGRRFLKETGIKYSEYLLEIRMEKAKELLKIPENSSGNVESIAAKIGLGHDVPYFYQLFKRYTGMTPKEYKKNHEIQKNTFS